MSDKAKAKAKKDFESSLLGLRNQFLTGFFGLNLAWLVLMVVVDLESEQLSVNISFNSESFCGPPCTKSSQNPLSFAFLLFYLVLLTIQFLCMVIHRWGSLITYISLKETASAA